MKNTAVFFSLMFILSGCQQNNQQLVFPDYPNLEPMHVSENYFGTVIQDDYRNMEDLKDSIVLQWFKEQGVYSKQILDNISGRNELIDKMRDFDSRRSQNVHRINITEDDQYFFLKREAGEDVSRLFYRKSISSEDELLYDPQHYMPESGKTYVISYLKPSWDGSYVVVALTQNGAEISEMIIIDMATRKRLPQIIYHCWPSVGDGVSWLSDNSGFIYLHFPEINPTSKSFLKDMKSVLYIIGRDPKDLDVIFSRETQPELDIQPEDFTTVVIENKKVKYLFGAVAGDDQYYDAYYAEIKDISSGKLSWKPLFKSEDRIKDGYFMDDTFICTSSKDAPNFRIISTTIPNINWDSPTVLVDEKKDEVIGQLRLTSNGIYFETNTNGVESKFYRLYLGREKIVDLPTPAGWLDLSVKGPDHPDLWISSMGWLNDYMRYRYDVENDELIREDLESLAEYPEFQDFDVKELLVNSYDGEEVPLSIIYNKNIGLNTKQPTILFGYGSYGFPINPSFSADWLTWIEEGGIMCIAHVRGGGEKGDSWHQSGKKTTKPNTWKDMIACTEYMIKEGYTSPKLTIIWGRSAGGIMVGRAITERPDLFAVAIAEVGVMNTLRFEHSPNGQANIYEFGSSTDSIECEALIEMDSYLHLEKGTAYPATFITTGMNDPRVIPWQPGKFAAKLQEVNESDKPIIFHVDFQSGHGKGDTRSKSYMRYANIYSFAFWQTGNPKYQLNHEALQH